MGPKRKTRIKLEKNNNRTPTNVRDPNVPIRKRSYDPKDDPLDIVAAKKPRTDPFHARPLKLNGGSGGGKSVPNGQKVTSGQRFHVNRDAKSDRSLKVTLSKEPSGGGGGGGVVVVESVLEKNGYADKTVEKETCRPSNRRAVDPEPDDVASQRRAFDAWCEDTYGEHSRSKTVTLKKHARVVRALRGAADEDTSKFRFWVRAKGFRIDAPTSYARTPADRCVDGKLRADPPLFIPDKNGTYRKVAIVEDFFDIIYNVHVDLEGRPGKHAGQKRTYRTITETFAFLPREAVTHFLAGCHACQRRPRSPQSGPSPSLLTPSPSPTPGVQYDAPKPIPASAAPTNYQESFENTLTDLSASVTTTPATPPPTKRRDDPDDVQDNKLSSTTFRTSRTPDDASSKPARYSKTHLLLRRDHHRHHRRHRHEYDSCKPCDLSTGGGRSDDASATEQDPEPDGRSGGEYRAETSATSGYCGEFKIDRDRNGGGVDGGSRAGQLCRDSRGQEFDLNMPITHALLRHAPPSGHHLQHQHNHHQHHQQHHQQQHENMPTPDSADAVEDNHFGGTSVKDGDKLKLMLLAWNYHTNAQSGVVGGGGGVTTPGDANSALPADHIAAGLWANYHAAALNLGKVGTPPVVPREQSSPVLAETGSAHDETSSSGNKDDEDDDDDESDDRIDAHTHDPERLKAFNMFVRLFVDENLDRMVPISKQPKEKIQAIIDSCTRQFPEFAERARKRIRTYLKSCRRNKRARDPSVSSPWDAARPTPAHLTSAQAEQILATACENESANAKRMRVGLEPVSQPMPTTASNTQPVDATAPIRDAVDFVARATVASRPTARDPTPPSSAAAQAHNGGGGVVGTAASAYRPPPGFPTHVQERAPPGIDLSVDKHTAGAPPPRPLLTHKLSAGEMAAVRQLVTGYRESAAFLLRSADELEQLLLQQQ